MNSSRRLTSKNLATAAATLAAVLVCGGQARAVNDLLAGWNFAAFTTVTDNVNGQVVFFDGGGASSFAEMTATHTSALSDWSSQSGNGPGVSYSATNWPTTAPVIATGNDYYQFKFDTPGASGIGFQFDQISSSTGPKDFKVQYSTDGTTFTDLPGGTYSVQVNDIPSWSTIAAVAPAGLDTYNFNLSSITALNNRDAGMGQFAYLRLTAASINSAGGSTVGTGGTNRLDNVRVYSNFDATQSPVPQPIAPPVSLQGGDLVLAFSSNRAKGNFDLVRGASVANGGAEPAPLAPWQSMTFIQRVQFDNLGGTKHNVQGNLLGMDAGAQCYHKHGKNLQPANARISPFRLDPADRNRAINADKRALRQPQ